MPSHTSNRRRSWFVTPGVWPAVTGAYSAQHNGGNSCTAKLLPLPLPPPPTLLPGATPPSDPTMQWAARSQATPASAPADGDNGAPHPAASIIVEGDAKQPERTMVPLTHASGNACVSRCSVHTLAADKLKKRVQLAVDVAVRVPPDELQ